ncbi:MAG: sodium-dependent transporter [Sphingomonadales bacterium]
MTQSSGAHENWSSRLVFLLATIGFSVGLGNIWRFPYIAGQNGGGAFVLVYLLTVSAIALPLVMAEILIGRRAGLSPARALARIARDEGRGRYWSWLGGMTMLTAFLITSYYAVIGGWTLDYAWLSVTGVLSGLDSAGSTAAFDSLLASPLRLVFWQSIFLTATVWIVARGLSGGIEKAVKFLMPLLFALLVILVAFALVVGDARAGLDFLFYPDFSRLSWGMVLAAVGQAFFSVGVAMAAMMTYGAYLPRHVSIPNSAVMIVAADTGVALLAGIAIFPLVFGYGLEPMDGAGLIFRTLPVAFSEMPGGQVFGTLFFLLLVSAALTSCIAIIEPIVSWAEEHRGIRRSRSAAIAGVVLWATGLFTVISFNIWAGVRPLGFLERFKGASVFNLIDFLTANVMLPAGGLLIAIFAGWMMTRESTADELSLDPAGMSFRIWRGLIRFLVPPAIALVLVFGVIQGG